MNSQTPFWPLVRNELGIDRYSKPALAVGLSYYAVCCWAVGKFPLEILFEDKSLKGDPALLFVVYGDVFLPWMTVLWLTAAAITFGGVLIPWKSGEPANPGTFEFLLTRAIDRRTLYRAKASVILVMMLAPLLVDLLACLVFRNGAQAYVGWLLWSGTLTLLLTQGWYALIGKYFIGRGWLMFLVIGAAMLAGLTVAVQFPNISMAFYVRSLLFFSAHPVLAVMALAGMAALIEPYSARRFAELEIL
jgi:hypothetical protein